MILNQIVRGLIKKEFLQLMRDPKMIATLVIAPVLQLTMFGYAISSDVKNVKLHVQAPLNDFVSQNIFRSTLDSELFIPANGSLNDDPLDLIQGNKADAVMIAPPGGVAQNMRRREGASIQLLLDATNVTKAQSVESYIQAIAMREVSKDQIKIPRPPGIVMDTRVLYNPAMESSIFMVPAVLGLLSCMLPILLTAMAMTKEKEEGTFEMLLSSPATPKDIVLGKTIPYVLLGLCHLPLTLPVAHWLFGVPIRAPLIVIILAFIAIICVTVSCGVLISTISRTQQQSMMGAFMFIFPAMMLSGMMFPVENMPAIMRVFTYINPLTYFLALLRCLMLKGVDPFLVLRSMGILVLMAIVIVTFTFNRFKTTIS